ncbi:MAG: VIT domain-containing protein [Phycisphaerales bacterium]
MRSAGEAARGWTWRRAVLAGVLAMGIFGALGERAAASRVDERHPPAGVHAELPKPDLIIVPPARVRPWRAIPVEVQSVGVRVSIDEQVATTTMELVLWNPARSAQEAQLVLPVPDGVTVRSFQYDGTGPEPTAVILPREEARRIYDSIVHRSRDPGLLEFAGYNVIRTSVFPVPACEKQSVRLVYEQVLVADAGRVDYFLPRSEALGASNVRWSMEATLSSSRAIATVYSPSHEIAVDRQGSGGVTVRVPERASNVPGPFRLSYVTNRAAGDAGIVGTILAYPDPAGAGGAGGGGYFLLLGGLPEVPTDRNPVKREITVVIDRSGSMRGTKMEQAKAAAVQILEGLRAGEAFNIIDFSDSIASFAAKPVIKDAESAARARSYINAIQANGGTALNDALMEALRAEPMDGMLPMVIFLTDGLPTVGERREVVIRTNAEQGNVHERRVFTFGVGFDVNTPLLSALARASRGAPTFVLPEENVETAVSQVFRRLEGPVMTSPVLTAVGADGRALGAAGGIREVLPTPLADLFSGDQLVVLGRYSGEKGLLRLRLEGEYLGKKGSSFEYELDRGAASARHGFVPRLWATRKIGALIEAIRQAGATPGGATNDPKLRELIDEIVRLSTAYGILTEYTSFLATDGEGRRADGGGAAVPMDAAGFEVKRALSDRAQTRSGAGAMNQEQNVQVMAGSAVALKSNAWLGEDMRDVEVSGIQMVDGHALYQRAGNRWVDARILSDEAKEPERTVEFGTAAYEGVLASMARENLLWALTNRGDLYLLLDGKRTLVKQP